jgi:alkanesulfonate monooxygenase SsuD/methylene tetrahydromethanopterin reductase-like flavin-dependent oxidoreductase (luciferase family)
MAGFDVGVQLHPQATTIDELRAAWRAADQLGVDSIWTWDHFFPLYGDPAAPHFEAWSLLGHPYDLSSVEQLLAARG